jgi:hypothetical protein
MKDGLYKIKTWNEMLETPGAELTEYGNIKFKNGGEGFVTYMEDQMPSNRVIKVEDSIWVKGMNDDWFINEPMIKEYLGETREDIKLVSNTPEFEFNFNTPIETFDYAVGIMKQDNASKTDIALVEYLIERVKRLEADIKVLREM